MRASPPALLVVLALAAPFPALAQDAPGDNALPFRLVTVASGFTVPLGLVHAGDGSGRLFVLEQVGLVKVLKNAMVDPVPYLDVRSKVSCCGERGLLGLAFHPAFEDNGKLFVSYTRAVDGASVLEKLAVSDPANGRPSPNGEVLLVQSQPFANHNGGNIAFGPDGYLYFGLGDGGAGGDPFNLAQNPNTLLGKMLRLDVNVASGYAIPPDNPFANGGGRPEIWALGLRNPWRWSFDRATGDLWIADVGQNLYEEVNRQPRLSKGGENYGWRWWEGLHAYVGGGPLNGMTFPVLEYPHSLGCSVTGGYVYHGTGNPFLTGLYVYGDFCSGRIWAAVGAGFPAPLPTSYPVSLPANVRMQLQSGGAYRSVQLADTSLLISGFGEDEAGEVYVVHYFGSVQRIVAA